MDQEHKDKQPTKKKTGIPPGIILLIIAVIVFGLMFAFNYLENLNPDWLRPAG